MYETSMMIAGLPIIVEYEHDTERDPYGTGDSPTKHYIDVMTIRLDDSSHNIRDLFEAWIDDIEDIILAEVS